MRRKFLTIFSLALATTIVISACKAEGLSNEIQSSDSTRARGAVGAIDDKWEMTSFDAEGLDSSRFGLLRTRIIDGTFKDINSIIVSSMERSLSKSISTVQTPTHCTT